MNEISRLIKKTELWVKAQYPEVFEGDSEYERN